MTFADLALGDTVFVDANVFVYHFAPDPILQVPCGQLLQRIESQEIVEQGRSFSVLSKTRVHSKVLPDFARLSIASSIHALSSCRHRQRC